MRNQEKKINERITVRELKTSTGFGYKSETHWGSAGICYIFEELTYDDDAPKEYTLHWGSGGTNKGFTPQEIAEAMSAGFKMAAARLAFLERED